MIVIVHNLTQLTVGMLCPTSSVSIVSWNRTVSHFPAQRSNATPIYWQSVDKIERMITNVIADMPTAGLFVCDILPAITQRRAMTQQAKAYVTPFDQQTGHCIFRVEASWAALPFETHNRQYEAINQH